MVMVLNRRTGRMIREHKARYIGVLFLVFLGSYSFVVAAGLAGNLGALVSGFAEKNLQEDLSFSTDIPLSDLASLEARSGAVIEAYENADVTLAGGQQLRLMSPCGNINIPAITSGRGLEGPGEILLNPGFCTSQGVKIGDRLFINGRNYTVVGTMALPHYVYPLKNIYDMLPPGGFGIGLVQTENFRDFPDVFTVYSARFNDRNHINGQASKLHELLIQDGHELSEWVDSMNNKRIRMPWASITGMRTMSVPIPAAMFLLCCLIMGIMIWRIVKADTVVIGTLYAQGYRRNELIRHYLRIPLIIALTGGAAGVLLAAPCISPAIHAMISYYNIPITGINFSPVNIIIGIFMPALFLGIAGFLVIHGELKKAPSDLMKGGAEKTRVNFFERSLKLERFKFKTKFALRSQLRSIPRLIFLLIGVTGSSIMMLMGFTISHSMNTVFSSVEHEDMYRFSREYSFKKLQYGEVPPGSTPFNAIRAYPENRESAEFYITGIVPGSGAIHLRDKSGGALRIDQVNITAPMASRLKLKTGDKLSFVNKMDGKHYSLTIDGIAETYAGQFIYMPLDDFNRMVSLPPDSYSGIFSNQELNIDEHLLSGTKDLQNLSGTMDELAAPMTSAVVFMTVIACCMAVIIIFLVTSLMIDESRTTISLFKVFGYRKKEINSLILNSSTIIVIFGFFLAVPLTVLSADAIYRYLGEMINMVLPILINPWYVLFSFVLIMLVYQGTKMLSRRKLDGISMGEALKAGTE